MRNFIAASVLVFAFASNASASPYDTARVVRERIVDLRGEIAQAEKTLASFGTEDGYVSKPNCLSAWDLFPTLDESSPSAYVRSLDSLGKVNPCFITTPRLRKELMVKRDELKQLLAQANKLAIEVPEVAASRTDSGFVGDRR